MIEHKQKTAHKIRLPATTNGGRESLLALDVFNIPEILPSSTSINIDWFQDNNICMASRVVQ